MPAPPFPDVTGVLVAGGTASRLRGVAKGLLRVGGEPIAARSLGLFARLFADALVVANDAAPYRGLGARVVPDVLAGKGAPGGVHAALAAARTRWIFAAACDMPYLSEEGIRFLASRREGVRAVGVVWEGRFEGLHAFWSVEALGAIEPLLRAGDPSLWQIAAAAGARFVEADAWRAVDPVGRAFANANTPEDAERLGLEPPSPEGDEP